MNVDDFLAVRFADDPHSLEYYTKLWREYEVSKLADPHFTREITNGDDGCFWSRVWEMVLYRHLKGLSSRISSRPAGPDFRVTVGEQPIYVEAVTPAPKGLPTEWLTPPTPGEARVWSFPHEEMLLRWTTAIKDKREKLDSYVKNGLIEPDLPTVIAVNSCRLSLWPEETGITQWPFAVEAVLPIGPLAVPVSADTGEFGTAYQSIRLSVLNRNGAPVPTDSFINPAYAGVSAVLGCATCRVEGGSPPMIVVHNPLARTPLPPGLLGATAEYVSRKIGNEFLIEKFAV